MRDIGGRLKKWNLYSESRSRGLCHSSGSRRRRERCSSKFRSCTASFRRLPYSKFRKPSRETICPEQKAVSVPICMNKRLMRSLHPITMDSVNTSQKSSTESTKLPARSNAQDGGCGSGTAQDRGSEQSQGLVTTQGGADQ